MKEVKNTLADMLKHIPGQFEEIVITGTDKSTVIEASHKEKKFILIGKFKEPIEEFEGEFALSSLSLLNGLLNFPSYKTDEAKFTIIKKERSGIPQVDVFEFKGKDGAKTRFKTIDPRFVNEGKRTSISNIPWDITIPLTKAKITEVSQLAGMLSEVDKMFGFLLEDGKLFLTIGGASEIMHQATILLAEDITKDVVNSGKFYSMGNLLAALKTSTSFEVNISFRGVIGISFETDKMSYMYYIRGES